MYGDDFQLCMGMGGTGIEERGQTNKSICNRHDLIHRKRAAQPNKANRPAICIHCSGIDPACISSEPLNFIVHLSKAATRCARQTACQTES